MKKLQLLSLIIAFLMILACFVSCGQPDETSAAPAETTKAATTTAAKTKAPETTTKAVTTKAATTTAEVTTAAPIVGLDDPIAAASHTEHIYEELPTFTAYTEQKADKTIGYYAYHCRYEGCNAIKDDKVYPTLIHMDFDGFNGTFLNYVKQESVQNVTSFGKAESNTNGSVNNGMWSTTGSGQTVFQDLSAFSTNEKFVMAADVLTGSGIYDSGRNLLFPTFGKYSQTVAASYYYCLGIAGKLTGDNKNALYGFCSFTPVHKVDGFTVKANQWYHLEYEVTMSSEKYEGIKVGDVKADGTTADEVQTFYRGTVAVYLTEMARNADGSMVRTGERTLVAVHTGFDALEDNGVDQNYDLFLVKFHTSGGKLGTLTASIDNFAVYLPGEAQQ